MANDNKFKPRDVTYDDLTRDQTTTSNDPEIIEKTMDKIQSSLESNRFSFKPLTLGQRRTVAQRLDELNVDPIAILAALAMGLDPRTGLPIVAVKPMKLKVCTDFTTKDGKEVPVYTEQIVNHEYPGATAETMAFCAKELASFVFPKLKQVEHKNELDDKKTFTVLWNGPQPSWARGKEKQRTEITVTDNRPLELSEGEE